MLRVTFVPFVPKNGTNGTNGTHKNVTFSSNLLSNPLENYFNSEEKETNSVEKKSKSL